MIVFNDIKLVFRTLGKQILIGLGSKAAKTLLYL